MLSRGGASGGASGLEKAVWIERLARPSFAESKVLISKTSSRIIFRKVVPAVRRVPAHQFQFADAVLRTAFAGEQVGGFNACRIATGQRVSQHRPSKCCATH